MKTPEGLTGGQPAPAIAQPGGRRFGVADLFGWGGLSLVVLIGALSSGLSGASMMLGLFALVVAVTAVARGRVGWARLASRTAGYAALGAALVLITVGGLATPPSKTSDTAGNAVSTASTSATPTSSAPSPTSSLAAPSAARSHKSAAAPSVPVAPSPVQTHTSGGITVNAAGAILPSSARTPGAVNPAVTQADIGQTICVSGWTATIRPDSSVTTELKKEQLATGYAYKGDTATGDYEEDHLISLEIGGAPDAEANLWPEPYNSPEGARVKDVVENRLHELVCDGAIALASAQRAIATNWWTAYQTYVGPATASTDKAAPAQPAPAPAPVALDLTDTAVTIATAPNRSKMPKPMSAGRSDHCCW